MNELLDLLAGDIPLLDLVAGNGIENDQLVQYSLHIRGVVRNPMLAPTLCFSLMPNPAKGRHHKRSTSHGELVVEGCDDSLYSLEK